MTAPACLARPSHEGGPQESELEREYGARHGSDCEEDPGSLGPSLRQLQIDAVRGAQPAPFGDRHHQRHRDPEFREDDMEGE